MQYRFFEPIIKNVIPKACAQRVCQELRHMPEDVFTSAWMGPVLGVGLGFVSAFSAWTLLVGRQEEHQACKKLTDEVRHDEICKLETEPWVSRDSIAHTWRIKNWVMMCWCCYLSGARCKWFAYCPADVTATLSSKFFTDHSLPNTQPTVSKHWSQIVFYWADT